MSHKYRVPTPRTDRPTSPDGPGRFSVGVLDSSDRHIEREGARSLFLRELFDICPDASRDLTRRSIEDWLVTWRLTEAPWIANWADAARGVLDRMQDLGTDSVPYHGEPYLDPLADDFPRSELTAAIAANPLEEDRATFLRRADEHWQARVALLESLGYERTNTKPTLDHVRWLIRYQVKGESFGAIARDGSDESADRTKTVTDAIKNLAHLIELPLRRPSRGGRPRKPSLFTSS